MTNDKAGLTLLELLISIAILGILMMGLHQAMSTAISAYDKTKNKQELLAQARYTMERMVMFVNETDYIWKPDDVDQEILKVSERVLDTYNNTSHAYDIDGDGFLDADNDSDKQVNESGEAADLITFNLDKTDSDNWKLQEQMPDYSTADTADFLAARELAEHVISFACNLLNTDLVEIELTLSSGSSSVRLKTRAKSRMID